MEEKFRAEIENGVPMTIIHIDDQWNTVSEESYNLENISLSEFQLDQLARALLQPCREFYSDPKHVKEFEEWMAKQEADK